MESNQSNSNVSSTKSVTLSTNFDSSDGTNEFGMDSPTKYKMIDEMQEKCGQLLSENRQLHEFKTQNEILRQTIESLEGKISSERNDLKIQISSLEKQNQSLLQRNNELEEKLSEIENQNNELKSTVNSLKVQIHEERMKSNDELDSQRERSSRSYESSLSAKDQQISELRSIIQNLTDESSAAGGQLQKDREEMSSLKEENDQVKTENRLQLKQLRALSNEVIKLRSDIDSKNKEISDFNEKLMSVEKELEESKESRVSKDGEIAKLSGELTTEKNKVIQLTSALPFNGDIEEYAHNVKDIIDQKKKLQIDLSSATGQLKKAANAIRKNQESINGLSQDVENERLKNVQLQKIIEENETKNSKLITQIKGLSQTRAASISVMRAFSFLCRQIDELSEKMEGKPASMRPLITTVILLKRWQLVVGTQQFYVTDQRNWWWLESSMNHRKTYDIVLEKISNVTSAREKVIEENTGLKDLMKDASLSIQDAELAIIKITEENRELKDKLAKYDALKDDLDKQLNGMKYIDVLELKQNYDSANSEINDLKATIERIQKDNCKLEQECNSQTKKASEEVAMRRKMQKECELLRGEINTLVQKIQLLELNQRRKEADMFALERRLKNQKDIAQDAVRQGFVITKENHKLVDKVIKQKNEIKQYVQKEKSEKEKEKKIRRLNIIKT